MTDSCAAHQRPDPGTRRTGGSLFSYNIDEYSAGKTGIVYYYLLIAVCAVVRLLTSPLAIETSLLIVITSNGQVRRACDRAVQLAEGRLMEVSP